MLHDPLQPDSEGSTGTRYVTFYSYKGGVGRTMTLANVAAWLATEAHKRVFLMDFDLEAPGLTYYANQTPLATELPAPGLVEYFTHYRRTATLPDLEKYVVEEDEDRLGGGKLIFMGAGKHGSETYATDLAKLDWQALYAFGFGFELMEHLRDEIERTYKPDIVLVDSRTGLHGIGSITVQHIPDLVVIVFGLNLQNLYGVCQILDGIRKNPYKAHTGRDIKSILAASPVYDEDSGLARDAIRRAEKVLDRKIDFKIPFSPQMAFEERLWPLDPNDAPETLLKRYARLGAALISRPAERKKETVERTPLESLVARLFEVEGYEVKSPERDMGTDLLAERDAFPNPEKIGVVVAEEDGGGLAPDRVTEWSRILDGQPDMDRLIVCTEKSPPVSLGEKIQGDRRISLVSMDDLMQRMIPFGRYLNELVKSFDEDEVSSYYEPLDATFLGGTGKKEKVDILVTRWLAAPDSPHLTLLGDYGTGKTTFCRRLAARMARQRLSMETGTVRVPVLVSLRNYAKALSVKSLVNDWLADRKKFASGGFAAFDLLNQEGKLLILLDGFDEMATRADERIMLENFRELKKLVHPRSKVILTCRTHYFQTRGQADSILTDRQADEELEDPGTVMVELAPLSPEQIESIVRRRADNPQEVLDAIRRIYDLEHLAQRPVLLDVILTTVPHLNESGETTGERLNAGRLYQIYTDLWIQKDIWRTRLNAEQRAKLMEALAVRMYTSETLSVHFRELKVFIREELGEQVATLTDLDYFDYDIRTCSFVRCDDQGNYSFMHKSFQEYFLARYFVRELTSEGTAGSQIFASRRLPREVALFLKDMEELCDNLLWKLTQKKVNDPNTDWGGGNAATVLALRGRLREVSGKNMAGRMLKGADFSSLDLTDFEFQLAVLDQSTLVDANLENADFRGASLHQAFFGGLEYVRVSIGWKGRVLTALDAGGGTISIWNVSDESLFPAPDIPKEYKIIDAEAHSVLPFLAMLLQSNKECKFAIYDMNHRKLFSTELPRFQDYRFLSLHSEKPIAVVSAISELLKIEIPPEADKRFLIEELDSHGFRGGRSFVTNKGIGWMGRNSIMWWPGDTSTPRKIKTDDLAAEHSPFILTSFGELWISDLRARIIQVKTDESSDFEPVVIANFQKNLPVEFGKVIFLLEGPGRYFIMATFGCVFLLEISNSNKARIVNEIRMSPIHWISISRDKKQMAVSVDTRIELFELPDLSPIKNFEARLRVHNSDFRDTQALDAVLVEKLKSSGARVG